MISEINGFKTVTQNILTVQGIDKAEDEASTNHSTNVALAILCNRECDNVNCNRFIISDSTFSIKSSIIPNSGFGCFTNRTYTKGDTIIEYVGEFLLSTEAALRKTTKFAVLCLA